MVTIACEKRIVRGRRLRVDTTVVEIDIHYPTDSSLLGDGGRVLARAVVVHSSRRLSAAASTFVQHLSAAMGEAEVALTGRNGAPSAQ